MLKTVSQLVCTRLKLVGSYSEEDKVYAKLYSPARGLPPTHLHVIDGELARAEFRQGIMHIPETVTTVSYASWAAMPPASRPAVARRQAAAVAAQEQLPASAGLCSALC